MEQAERVAIITVHGVADQQPGQTVGELARLLCNGGSDAARYVEGEKHEIILPVRKLGSVEESATAANDMKPEASPEPVTRVRPGRPSNFYLAHRRAVRERGAPAEEDLGVTLIDYLLSRYQPDERDALYESTRISLQRQSDGLPVDLYEMYWADYSRLRPGGIRALSASYQLLFHLSTLARDVVDQVALATRGGWSLRVLQWLHAWSAWLVKGPAALLQLMMLLLVAFGAAAFVPEDQQPFVLEIGGGVIALILLAFTPVVWLRADGHAARLRASVAWLFAGVAFGSVAIASARRPEYVIDIYFYTAAALTVAAGALLLRRYAETVRGIRLIGIALLLSLAILLVTIAVRTRSEMSTPYEWMLTTALNAGEYLLAGLLIAWALLAIVQIVALLLGFMLASRGDSAVAASLTTARIGMVVSSALFAILSLVMWSVISYVAGLTLEDFLFMPVVFTPAYRSAAIFFESQVTDVGTLFTPLMGLIGVIGAIVLVALAPSLREEIAPGADEQSAPWTARLGRWWTGARRVLGYVFGGFVPLLAIVGAVVYLLFVERKLFGVDNALDWLGENGDLLVTVGQWLAGGAVTITALGARFTETFGKLRVALDAALDIDNYFQDPANRLPPRARIYSRYASLLADISKRGYSRVVIVSHSQGTVITADLLRYLAVTRRLRHYVGTTPLSLVTVGSPLRDLYAALFPFLYRWMGAQPTSFATLPDPADLQLAQWVNAYRAGDYVGRAIWTAPGEPAMLRVARVADDGDVEAWRDGRRTEFCLGAGAHTHYFSNDAIALAVAIDRLVGNAHA